MKNNQLKLLYISGYARCGSTILSNILGEVDGFFNAGEIMYIWDRILSSKGNCGCGSHVCECEIWGEIIDKAFGENKRSDFEHLIKIRNSAWQSIKIPLWMLFPSKKKQLRVDLDTYLKNLNQLYETMGSVLSDTVIIDSSKNPAYLYILSMALNLDIYVVHIVRDPRATAYSWLSKKAGFAEIGTIQSSLSWSMRNGCCGLFKGHYGHRYLLVKYEDLIASPQKTIHSILQLMGESKRSLTFLNNDGVDLKPNHCVFGNPNLFKTGLVKLRLDTRWKNMTEKDKLISSTITWPLNLKYGYPLYLTI